MMKNLTIGGLKVSVEPAKELAGEHMNQPGRWSYPVYDSYLGNGDPDTIGPQDVLAAGLLNAGQNPLTTQYTFESLSDERVSPFRYISTHSWLGTVPLLVVATDTILPAIGKDTPADSASLPPCSTDSSAFTVRPQPHPKGPG